MAAASSSPAAYLLIAAVQKKMNMGMLMRSAAAMNVQEILVTGPHRAATFGAQGTERFIPVRHFDRLRDATAWLRERGVTICGIELTADAAPVQSHPFRGPTCFFPGNEGAGLVAAHKAVCDHFVYIPQYGRGTASLNVTVATSIVLHHFGLWAGYAEAERDSANDKFVVGEPPRLRGQDAADVQAAKTASRSAGRTAAEKEAGEFSLTEGGSDWLVAEA
jgi:tRNA(Leu) C34 or U34 (ribose-2'-O)-methylase TrmL